MNLVCMIKEVHTKKEMKKMTRKEKQEALKNPQRYNIARFRTSKDYMKVTRKIIIPNVTLEEAQEYCSRPDTKGTRWFDGYEKI